MGEVADIGAFSGLDSHAPGRFQQDARIGFPLANDCRKDDRLKITGKTQLSRSIWDFGAAGGVADQPKPVAAPEELSQNLSRLREDDPLPGCFAPQIIELDGMFADLVLRPIREHPARPQLDFIQLDHGLARPVPVGSRPAGQQARKSGRISAGTQ